MEILFLAHEQNRILVTLDKEFDELAIVKKIPHRGIIRLVDIPAREQANVILRLIYHYSDILLKGAILTVDQKKVRIRPPEADTEETQG